MTFSVLWLRKEGGGGDSQREGAFGMLDDRSEGNLIPQRTAELDRLDIGFRSLWPKSNADRRPTRATAEEKFPAEMDGREIFRQNLHRLQTRLSLLDDLNCYTYLPH